MPISGNAPTLRFGSSIASAGDVNGDGYPDIVIGAYFSSGGHAFLYNGNSSSGKEYVCKSIQAFLE
ncbi:MAG: FG-GAP repeat protein [Ignavibacteria bacterium]|nr:FG-GAP repeat protein [Ignavibacteria bacterium]